MKKIMAGLLALTMAFGGLTLSAAAYEKADFGSAISAEAETYGDFEYSVLDDGTVEITKYTGDDSTVTIPSEINGKKVSSIGKDAFYKCTSLKSVTIPNSVTSIGDCAFMDCASLSSVTIPNSVTSIANSMFARCTSLKSVTIPKGVTTIGIYAFDGCTSLTSISMPNTLNYIDRQAFAGCKSLKSVTIPENVTHIGWEAFCSCTSLKSVTIPRNVTEILENSLGYYYDSNYYRKKIPGFKIKCYSGTAGEKYAKDNGFDYELLDGNSTTVGKPVTTTFSCTDTAIRINWKKATNASGYRIYRYNTSTKKWETAATLSGTDTLTYKQTGLKSGTTYKYKVKAYAKSNGKTYWGEASDTLTTTTKPSKPVVKSYSSTSSAVRINWNTVTGATGYRVYRYDAKTKKWVTIATIKDGSANTYRDSGRKSKTSYKYKVKAYRKVNDVNYWSDTSAAKTCKTK